MRRQGRFRGSAFGPWVAGAVCLLAPAGCGSAGSASSSTPERSGAHPAATFGKSVELERVSGTVLVTVPSSNPVALTASREVPVGTLVDTTAGRVRLTSATPAPTRFQTGVFHGGMFKVLQNAGAGGLTDLVIRDNVTRRSGCGQRPSGVVERSGRVLGLLRGNASGRFRTVGRFAAGTVLGTEWGVRDRCDGTLVVVTRGSVEVRDLRLGRSILLHAGQTYLASAS
jgi:hypothetical protein